MFYIHLNNGLPQEVKPSYPGNNVQWADRDSKGSTGWMSSRDFDTREQADAMARYLTAMTGDAYLGVDEGPGTSPRYRIVKAPKVGDPVSMSFNGDTYPCGRIVKITPTWIVTTDTGKKFRRWKETGGWREQGRGFWLVSGHIDELNPHF
jgi:hypothetical protein